MDTQTVLEIIKIIENKIQYNSTSAEFQRENMEYHCADAARFVHYMETQNLALKGLQEHLQSFIEGQLNAAELSTGE